MQPNHLPEDAKTLRHCMTALKINQTELAEMSGVALRTVNNYRNGHTRVPKFLIENLMCKINHGAENANS